jgi:hypothetical protein
VHLVEIRLVNALDDRTLVIALKVPDFDAELLPQRAQLCIDLIERDRPVLLRVTLDQINAGDPLR